MATLNSLKDVPAKIIAWHRELIELQTERSGGCWIWTKSKNWDGYGTTSLGGRTITVHRVSYLLHKGEIPDGMVIRHCCPGGENRACVNPDHLLLGSKADNNRDTSQRGKAGKGGPRLETNCPLRIQTATLASDGMIYEHCRKRVRPALIAKKLGLPLEHVSTVMDAICDSNGCREASYFEKRFWSKVNKTTNCWIWKAMTTAGYGRIRMDGKIVGAHQASWRLHFGPIPRGKVVCHNCPSGDMPKCVNPQHLFVASQAENLRDRSRKKRLGRPGAHMAVDF